MPGPWGTPRRDRRPTWLAIGTLLVMALAFLALKLFTPPAPTPPPKRAANVPTDWRSFLVTVERRWAMLQRQIASLGNDQPAATPTPHTLGTATAEKIRIQLQRRLAARLGVDLDSLQAALPEGWTAALTAPFGRDANAPAAILTLTQTAPCLRCRNRCLIPPEPILFSLYQRTASSTVTSSGNCQPQPVATTTAFRLIDACANAVSCEDRDAVRTTAINFFHPTTTPP